MMRIMNGVSLSEIRKKPSDLKEAGRIVYPALRHI
jgi:hypothetical protein